MIKICEDHFSRSPNFCSWSIWFHTFSSWSRLGSIRIRSIFLGKKERNWIVPRWIFVVQILRQPVYLQGSPNRSSFDRVGKNKRFATHCLSEVSFLWRIVYPCDIFSRCIIGRINREYQRKDIWKLGRSIRISNFLEATYIRCKLLFMLPRLIAFRFLSYQL